MFKKVYEEEFGMFGGASYGALIGDYEFGNHPQDHGTCWRKCLRLPLLPMHRSSLQPASSLFNLDSFTELGNPRDLSKIFQSVEYAKWRSFREYGRLPIRGAVRSAHPDASAVWPSQRPGRGL
jgi:type VI secretion system protein ImpC